MMVELVSLPLYAVVLVSITVYVKIVFFLLLRLREWCLYLLSICMFYHFSSYLFMWNHHDLTSV